MIVKILSRGKSFKGLGSYLTHDPDAKSEERVGWTHSLNLAHDHVPSAIDEMLWTSRHAELLKQEAGIRAGGRATENPVKHISLNWAPDEDPSRDHMIQTTKEFLRHMKWQEHQALLVAHEDKAYAHVHVMLNVIHPETGLRLDDNFERRRAQAWALEYEREQGRIYCEQRLADSAERVDAPTRPAWMAFQEHERNFERDEKVLAAQAPIFVDGLENPENTDAAEWKMLKKMQRDERLAFFADGKSAFSELRGSIYREVREDFRERWSEFYTAQHNGGDPEALKALKAELTAEQKAVLEERRDAAYLELRQSRDALYQELLGEQQETRTGLRWRQDAGFDNELYLRLVDDVHERHETQEAFRAAADETTTPRNNVDACRMEDDVSDAAPRHEDTGMKSGTDIGLNVGVGLSLGIGSLFEGLADGLMWAKPDPKRRAPEPKSEERKPDLFEAAIDEARKRQQLEQEEADRAWRERQRSYGE